MVLLLASDPSSSFSRCRKKERRERKGERTSLIPNEGYKSFETKTIKAVKVQTRPSLQRDFSNVANDHWREKNEAGTDFAWGEQSVLNPRNWLIFEDKSATVVKSWWFRTSSRFVEERRSSNHRSACKSRFEHTVEVDRSLYLVKGFLAVLEDLCPPSHLREIKPEKSFCHKSVPEIQIYFPRFLRWS